MPVSFECPGAETNINLGVVVLPAESVGSAMAVENPKWKGHEKFFLNANDTMITVETMKAIEIVYPKVEIRDSIKGFQAPLLTNLAKEKFGWEPKYSWRDNHFS